jgi:SAM-dependent methyltransferase
MVSAEHEPSSARFRRVLRNRVPPPAQEIYGRRALARIARALPPIERAYASIRFTILRPKILSVLDLLLPDEGRILDIGCGFGLFAAYFAQTQPGRTIVGVDPDARRVKMAERTCERLGLGGHRFIAGDARDTALEPGFDAAYVLDVMHHIPEHDQEPLLRRIRDLLAPRGVLVMKDITTEPWLELKFTEYLDRMMVGWKEPLMYRHHREWGEMLAGLGFKVRTVRVPDVLPYPHVVIAATKVD